MNTVNLSMMSTGQQFILWFLIGIVSLSFSLVIFLGVLGFVLDGLRGRLRRKKGRGRMAEREKGQKWANFGMNRAAVFSLVLARCLRGRGCLSQGLRAW